MIKAILIGTMGSGKSTVGRTLARRLGVEFIDTDAEIERSTGRAIADIFAVDGEPEFRRIEEGVVAQTLSGASAVVSLGGGAVLSEHTRELLTGLPVVYLTVSAEAGYARVAQSDRPLLRSDNPEQKYADLLRTRDGVYRQVAAITVDTSSLTPQEISTEVARQLETIDG